MPCLLVWLSQPSSRVLQADFLHHLVHIYIPIEGRLGPQLPAGMVMERGNVSHCSQRDLEYIGRILASVKL